jgi:hypothetical protein
MSHENVYSIGLPAVSAICTTFTHYIEMVSIISLEGAAEGKKRNAKNIGTMH